MRRGLLGLLGAFLLFGCGLERNAQLTQDMASMNVTQDGGVSTLDGQLEVFSGSISLPVWLIAALRETQCPVRPSQMQVEHCITEFADDESGSFQLNCIRDPTVLQAGGNENDRIRYWFEFVYGRCAIEAVGKSSVLSASPPIGALQR